MNEDLTLLYVEDNEAVKENFTLIFSKYFKNVITTDNGRDALKIYEENKIDIAVLDISIPEINGLEVAKIIREKDKNIEIIMLTGHSEREKLLEAIHLQLFSYLVKPIKKNEIVEVLTRLLSKLDTKDIHPLAHGYTFDARLETLHYQTQPIKISKHEKKLIAFLCTNSDSHYTACDISQILFDEKDIKDTRCNNIIQLISRFKKKMLNSYNKESFFIDNIYGLGYKINM